MTVFQNTGMHLRVLLMNYLQSREQKWYRVSTAFLLTSRRTEIATSAWNQNNKGTLQKTHFPSRTSSRKFWWLHNSRSQSPQWGKCIQRQSSVRCCGTRLGNTMYTIISMWNKNFSGNGKELTKVLGTDEETKSHLYWQLLRILQSLWRGILESLYVNTSPIGSKWDCWESGAQN